MKPSEKAFIKAKRANKQLTGNKVKKIQRRKNIANQLKPLPFLVAGLPLLYFCGS